MLKRFHLVRRLKMITAIFLLTLCGFVGWTGITILVILYMFKISVSPKYIHIYIYVRILLRLVVPRIFV